MELSVLPYFGKGFDEKNNFFPVNYSSITHLNFESKIKHSILQPF